VVEQALPWWSAGRSAGRRPPLVDIRRERGEVTGLHRGAPPRGGAASSRAPACSSVRPQIYSSYAQRFGAPLSTVHGEVARLTDAGLLRRRSVGKAALVAANTQNRLIEPLVRSWGPTQVIADEFGKLPRTERVLVFGSWAARYQGRTGPPPHDLDVLVVGQPGRESGAAADGSPLLAQAERTAATAVGLVATDAYSAYVLANDATRFACVALLAQQGLRSTTNGDTTRSNEPYERSSAPASGRSAT
jgi:hypothetical protein